MWFVGSASLATLANRDGYYQKQEQKKTENNNCWWSCAEFENSCPLLIEHKVGQMPWENGMVPMENGIVGPQKIKYKTTIWPTNFTSGHIPPRIKSTMVVSRDWRKSNGELVFQLGKMKKFWRQTVVLSVQEPCNLCININVFNVTELHAFKWFTWSM